MKNKIYISTFIFLVLSLFIFSSTNVYAWTDDEMMNTKTKYEYDTLTSIDNFYATPNMDSVNVIKKYYKELIWNGGGAWYEPDNDIYMEFGDYSDPDVLVLEPHYGYNKTVYPKMVRPKTIESYDGNAEYIIGYSSYDQILIIVDGDTFKGNLGDLVNDFFKNKAPENIRCEHEFYMPYKFAAKEGGVSSISRYRSGTEIYMATCNYQVGFNLTKEKEQLTPEPSQDDPAIYGGNNETKIDDTPSTPTKNENNTFKIVGIVISSILSVIGIYLIYLLIKKIYQIMKG